MLANVERFNLLCLKGMLMHKLSRQVNAAFLSFGSFIAFIYALNYFKITYYPTIRRMTHVKIADLTLTGDKLIDTILMIVSLSLGIILLLISLKKDKDKRRLIKHELKVIFLYLLLILIVIQIGALTRWITYPIYPTKIYSDFSWHFANLEMQLFYITGLATPVLLVLLFFWWAAKPIFVPILKWLRFNINHLDYKENIFSNKIAILVLLFSIILSVIASIYPYLPTVNPSNISVSVDVIYYKEWVSQLKSFPSQLNVIIYAFSKAALSGDRPIPLLVMYGLDEIFNNLDRFR
jgi:hypothetical protein